MDFSEWFGAILEKIIQAGFDADDVNCAFKEAQADIQLEYGQGDLGAAGACFIKAFEKYDDELNMARQRGEGFSSRKIGDQRGITEDEAAEGWRRGTKKKLALLNGFWGGEVDISVKRRKIFYYLPLIRVVETIKLSGFSISPFLKDGVYSGMLTDSVFDGLGSVIEVDGFESYGYLDPDIDMRIFDSVERLKFGYFFLNPSYSSGFSGYVSSETFECFRIIEKNPDGAFEQKVGVSNGMFEFSESLEAYYRHRISHSQRPVELTEFNLSYVDFLTDGLPSADHMAAIRMYNRCWSTYSIHSHFDKALFAKVSSELVLSLKGMNKKNNAIEFSTAILKNIKKFSDSSPVVLHVAQEVSKRNLNLNDEIEKNLSGLKSARDKISHDGVPDYSHVNIPFYLIWFPVFWILMFCENKLTEREGIRLALFCGLMCFKVNDWQKLDFESVRSAKSHLYIYDNYSTVIPKYLKRDDAASIIKNCMESITNWLKP
ncbi:hypothetical protein [Pseudomonas fragi]|uniref:hypothetical protein n=1 Tax=Pseudomonas fragi TaxID=296 RepID=UPI0014739A8D|nr:hypothetical protein [Pseudomonas fragi]NNB55723.1 hypothetical protein [Pseudomonas fragi]